MCSYKSLNIKKIKIKKIKNTRKKKSSSTTPKSSLRSLHSLIHGRRRFKIQSHTASSGCTYSYKLYPEAPSLSLDNPDRQSPKAPSPPASTSILLSTVTNPFTSIHWRPPYPKTTKKPLPNYCQKAPSLIL